MVTTGRADIDRALDAIRRTLTFNFLDGAAIVRGVALVAGTPRKVPHTLGRKLQGYIIVGIRNNSAVGYIEDNHNTAADLDKYATLTAVGFDPTVDLVFF